MTPVVDIRKDAYWFGEAQGRVIVTVGAEMLNMVLADVAKAGIACTVLGTVTSGNIEVQEENWGHISEWKNSYDTAIENMIQ